VKYKNQNVYLTFFCFKQIDAYVAIMEELIIEASGRFIMIRIENKSMNNNLISHAMQSRRPSSYAVNSLLILR
jgi:hypothetical protein